VRSVWFEVTPWGSEQSKNPQQNTGISEKGGAESGALGVDSLSAPASDPELLALIRAWPSLSDEVRHAINNLRLSGVAPVAPA